ncbi:MAG: DUF2249 domain-containing protein [Sterolibacterium sp.]
MPERRVIDGRDLVPPEPLELTLAALDKMAPGEDLYLLLHCEAVPLYTILRRNGYPYSNRWLEDGTNEIRITKA